MITTQLRDQKLKNVVLEILRYDWGDGYYNKNNVRPVIENFVQKIKEAYEGQDEEDLGSRTR